MLFMATRKIGFFEEKKKKSLQSFLRDFKELENFYKHLIC